MEGIMNVAILGVGNIAEKMAEALSGIKEEVCLYAVASRTLEKAKMFAQKWGEVKAYGSYEELVKDENVDLIYIATPHSEHFHNAKLCLENGKNCLVEKAFCANLVQAKQLIELAKTKHVLLAEAMWTRYQPSRELIKRILDEGKIGEIHYVESDFSVPIKGVERLVNPALAGGALLDLGVYSLTVPAMYLGCDIKKVKTEVVKMDTGVDATTTVFLTYDNGVMVRAKCSAVDENSNYAKFVGEKGYLLFGPINAPVSIELYDVNGTLCEKIQPELKVNGYEYQVLECKRAIMEGRIETMSMPHAETIRLMGWMDSIRNHTGIIYPFETKEDINHRDEEVWGKKNIYDDVNPWDRENTRSYLEIYDIEHATREVVAEFEGVVEAPNWSHDGAFLTYNANGKIYKFDLADHKSHMIASGTLDAINNDHVISADDKEIAVSDSSAFDGMSRIYTIPIDGGNPILVTQQAPSYLHGWSLDKQSFCYCAEREGKYDVYEIKRDSVEEIRLTTAPGLNDGCEYDVMGKNIYFNSVRTGLMQAWKMKRDGSEQTQLTFDKDRNTWFPHISPDGSKIVMISYQKGDLWPGDHVPNKKIEIRMMNADGTNLKTLMTIFGGQGTMNVNSWSPDSKKFAFVRYEKRENYD